MPAPSLLEAGTAHCLPGTMPASFLQATDASILSPKILLHAAPPMSPGEYVDSSNQSYTSGSFTLSLAEAIPEPDLPSLGSAGHSLGTCKPCGFFHKAGCSSGANCTFCHLCDSGEKRRRQVEKHKQHQRQKQTGALRRQSLVIAAAGGA